MSVPNIFISPQLELPFEAGNKVSSSSITLTNPYDKFVAYKIKSNSTGRYVVKPPIGVIRPKSNVVLPVSAQPNQIDSKDCLQISVAFSDSKELTSDFWGTTSSNSIEKHLLKVIVAPKEANASRAGDVQKLQKTMNKLTQQNSQLATEAAAYRRWSGTLTLLVTALVGLLVLLYTNDSLSSVVGLKNYNQGYVKGAEL